MQREFVNASAKVLKKIKVGSINSEILKAVFHQFRFVRFLLLFGAKFGVNIFRFRQ